MKYPQIAYLPGRLAGNTFRLIFVSAFAAGCSNTYAQPTPGGPAPSATVVIDGSVNPAAVPDDMGFLHFFRVLSPDPNASSEQADLERRRSYLRYFFCRFIGGEERQLDEVQQERVLEHVGKVAKLMAAAGLASAPGTPASARIAEVVGATMRELESALGPEIARKVRLHVTEYMKTKIRYVRIDIPYPAR